MNAPITLHVEAGDNHFSAHLECAGNTRVLTEEDFQILTDQLADTALPPRHILQSFMTTHGIPNKTGAQT